MSTSCNTGASQTRIAEAGANIRIFNSGESEILWTRLDALPIKFVLIIPAALSLNSSASYLHPSPLIMTLRLTLFFLASTLTFFSCDDEDALVLEAPPTFDLPEDPFACFDPDYLVDLDYCDTQSGSVKLLPTSFQLLPYQEGDQVEFVNEEGTVATFTAAVTYDDFSEGPFIRFIRDNEGAIIDTFFNCFRRDIFNIVLTSETLGNRLTCRLEAFPDYRDPTVNAPIDWLLVFNRPAPDSTGFLKFRKGVTRSGFPFSQEQNRLDTLLTLNGRTFQYVESFDIPNLDYPVWYTQRDGLVAFEAIDGKLWRLR